jgi:hypothetical protein
MANKAANKPASQSIIVNGSHCDFEQQCKALQSIAKHCKALQSIAKHCKALQSIMLCKALHESENALLCFVSERTEATLERICCAARKRCVCVRNGQACY